MASVPTITKFVQIALDVEFAELMVSAFEKSLCMRDGKVDTA